MRGKSPDFSIQRLAIIMLCKRVMRIVLCELGGPMRLLKRYLAALALAGFCFASAPAQEKLTTPLIPREVLFGNPEPANPPISPDGTHHGHLAPIDGCLNSLFRTLGET